jgi:hypothetical protein
MIMDALTDRRAPAACGAALFGAIALLLSACGGPQLASGTDANPSAARGLLVATASQGPVPLAIDTAPPTFPGGPLQVAGTASDAVSWLGARFEPVDLGAEPADSRRVVFRFEQVPPDPAAACAGTLGPSSLPPGPQRLFAVYCDGARPVADVTGTAEGDTPADADRLVAAVTDRLFPGRSEAGYSRGFPGVSLGVGVGSGGGWGLGTGLFF